MNSSVCCASSFDAASAAWWPELVAASSANANDTVRRENAGACVPPAIGERNRLPLVGWYVVAVFSARSPCSRVRTGLPPVLACWLRVLLRTRHGLRSLRRSLRRRRPVTTSLGLPIARICLREPASRGTGRRATDKSRGDRELLVLLRAFGGGRARVADRVPTARSSYAAHARTSRSSGSHCREMRWAAPTASRRGQ